MRNRFFGLVGVVWGSLILSRLFTQGIEQRDDSAYMFGQYVGVGLGVLMFASGVYYLIRGDGRPKKKKEEGTGHPHPDGCAGLREGAADPNRGQRPRPDRRSR